MGPFSARARQITANIEAYETAWRHTHPGSEPGPELRRTWDRRAWAEARPDKITPTDGASLTGRWIDELYRLGYQPPVRPAPLPRVMPGALDREKAVELIVSRLGAKRSAWNPADVRGHVELLLAETNLVTDAAVRVEVAEDLTARTLAACAPLLGDPAGVPEHIRAWTSQEVLTVEADLTASFATRAAAAGRPITVRGGGLDAGQRAAVEALGGSHRLVVIEGAAGVGKTTTLAAAVTVHDLTRRRMVVVTPTLKAAHTAASQTGAAAYTAAWLAHQYGYRWDADGHWTRHPTVPTPAAVLEPGDLLLVDEAGMLDQDTARALVTIADETGARLALVGDRYQLPAVGRGGVFDLAHRWAHADARLTLDTVHRFTDPTYASLSLAMRTGHDPASVFDDLWDRGQIVIHPDEPTRAAALAREAAAAVSSGAGRSTVVVADTREQVAALNHTIRGRLVAEGRVDDTRVVVTQAGERVGVGDTVATRRNDHQHGVANRDTWQVSHIGDHGSLRLSGKAGQRIVPYEYAVEHVELAYASTVYGVQGDTVHAAHLALSDAPSAYVAMTRGRHTNTAHLVAETLDQARDQWVETFTRDRADLGPAHARDRAAHEAAKYLPTGPAQRRPRPDPGWDHEEIPEASRVRRPRPPLPAPLPTHRSSSRPGIGF